MRYQFTGDQPDGEYTSYYFNGQPKQTVTYRLGQLETFFESGQLDQEFSYKDGQVEGLFKTYSPEGVSLTEHDYKAGQPLVDCLVFLG